MPVGRHAGDQRQDVGAEIVRIEARRLAGGAELATISGKPVPGILADGPALGRAGHRGDLIHCVMEGALDHGTPKLPLGRMACHPAVAIAAVEKVEIGRAHV